MAYVTHYFPDDLTYSINGYRMERDKFDEMVSEIFKICRVVNVHVHGYGKMNAGEEMKNYWRFSKAITLKSDNPVNVEYCVHFTALSPVEIIETYA